MNKRSLTKSIKTWLLAARPKTLWAGICPVVMGSVLAVGDSPISWPVFWNILIVAILIQVGTNFANDYFDFLKGADTESRLGPTRFTQSGEILPAQMKTAFIVCFILSGIASLGLIVRGGWPIFVIGAASILCGILYTGGRYPIGYLGLGDLFVLMFFGPIAVGGTFFLHTLTINSEVLLLGLSPGLLSAAILMVNNLRDVDDDRRAGKKTLVVRLGKSPIKILYILVIVGAV
ncbi:MAG: 1,4-dihydroxy-2-naphthoate octaprenyltransferase, partial [Candidatus Marinamargulisbacteria bacterium]